MRRQKQKTRRIGVRPSLSAEPLEARQLLAGDLVISEFMAQNSATIADEDGDYSDWIEVYNQGDQELSLSGWHLTDDADELDKWSFPEESLPAGNFLFSARFGKDRTSGDELHTNFKISSDGEFLALTQDAPIPGDPQHIEIVSQFEVAFPSRASDVSYGIGQSVTVEPYVEAGDSLRYLLPTDDSLGNSWTEVGFSDTSWSLGKNAIGYQRAVPGFTVQDAHSTGEISNVSGALSLLSGNGVSSETTVLAPLVNFMDPGGGGGTGNYGDPDLFPNDKPGDDNDFAIRARPGPC